MRFELTRKKPIELDSPPPLPLGHLVILDVGDSWIFVELRKMEAIKNYADKDEIRTHAGRAHWIRQSKALTFGHLVIFDVGDSWIFVELRKLEAIKNYADKDEIRTRAGKTHWIRQSNALTTRPPCHIWQWRQLNICRIKKNGVNEKLCQQGWDSNSRGQSPLD
jgi:hypothetical protein